MFGPVMKNEQPVRLSGHHDLVTLKKKKMAFLQKGS